MMKYLYPIMRGKKDYHYGSTDVGEVNVKNLCIKNCNHESPVEASDCFREKLLKKKSKIISIETRKCCFKKCANMTEEVVNFGFDFQFPLCEDHQDEDSVREVCGFGFPLLLKDHKN